MPHLLGLTGNIACGKSTVGTMLLELGAAKYIDADAVVHSLYGPESAVTGAVAQRFGAAILDANGAVDRRALGNVVFGNAEALRQLEAIVHPAVHAAIAAQIAALPAESVAIVDAVKLLEGGLARQCAAVWLVVCAYEEELRRLRTDRSMSLAEAEARLQAQPDNAPRRALVDEVIDNGGTRDETLAQVRAAWQRFMARIASGEQA